MLSRSPAQDTEKYPYIKIRTGKLEASIGSGNSPFFFRWDIDGSIERSPFAPIIRMRSIVTPLASAVPNARMRGINSAIRRLFDRARIWKAESTGVKSRGHPIVMPKEGFQKLGFVGWEFLVVSQVWFIMAEYLKFTREEK